MVRDAPNVKPSASSNSGGTASIIEPPTFRRVVVAVIISRGPFFAIRLIIRLYNPVRQRNPSTCQEGQELASGGFRCYSMDQRDGTFTHPRRPTVPLIEAMDALPGYPSLRQARTSAVSVARRADRLRHDGDARDHPRAAG